MKIPEDLRYTKDHEWVRLVGLVARVGVTDYAQDALGDVVFVQLPIIGESLPSGATCSEVESTKSVSDIYSPVAGKIRTVNLTLAENPGLINSDPYNEGWIFELEVDASADTSDLLDASAYRQLIEG